MFDLMRFRFLAFEGPEIDDFKTLRRLPGPLRDILRVVNGFVAFNGGFHLRGACTEPSWHALSEVLGGELAMHKLFNPLRPGDVAFAQDALGDQFVLRGSRVLRLYAETAQIEDLKLDLDGFFEALQDDPLGFLDVQPLSTFLDEGGRLAPGQLIQAEPPFSLQDSNQPTRLSAVPARERLLALSALGRQMTLIPDAGLFELLGEP